MKIDNHDAAEIFLEPQTEIYEKAKQIAQNSIEQALGDENIVNFLH